jgi:hypothetical protein
MKRVKEGELVDVLCIHAWTRSNETQWGYFKEKTGVGGRIMERINQTRYNTCIYRNVTTTPCNYHMLIKMFFKKHVRIPQSREQTESWIRHLFVYCNFVILVFLLAVEYGRQAYNGLCAPCREPGQKNHSQYQTFEKINIHIKQNPPKVHRTNGTELFERQLWKRISGFFLRVVGNHV